MEEFFRNLPKRIGYQTVASIFEYRRQLIRMFTDEVKLLASKQSDRPNDNLKRLEGPRDDTNLTI
jgi:hypothetical protein